MKKRPLNAAILFVSTSGHFMGGAEAAFLELVGWAARRGFEPILAVSSLERAPRDRLSAIGVSKVIALEEGTSRPEIARLVREVIPNNSEHRIVSIVSNSVSVELGLEVSETLNVAHYWWVHESRDTLERYFGSDFTKLAKSLSEVQSSVIYCSERQAAELSGLLGVGQVVEPLPEISFLESLHFLLNTWRKPGRVVIAVVGTISRDKGQLTAVRAARHLKDVGLDFELRLVGSSHPHELANLLLQVRKLDLAKEVRIMGHISDVGEIYSGVDILVVTSRHETFGRTPWEAVARGMRVIYSRPGGVSDLLSSLNVGTHFLNDSSSDLAAVICRDLERRRIGSRLGDYATYIRLLVKRRASVKAVFSQIESISNS